MDEQRQSQNLRAIKRFEFGQSRHSRDLRTTRILRSKVTVAPSLKPKPSAFGLQQKNTLPAIPLRRKAPPARQAAHSPSVDSRKKTPLNIQKKQQILEIRRPDYPLSVYF